MNPSEPPRGAGSRPRPSRVVPDPRRMDGADEAWTMVSELVAAVVTWGGIGWLLDRWLDTAPLLLMIGIVIGTATGFFLVILRHNRMIDASRPPYGSKGAPTSEGPARDDD